MWGKVCVFAFFLNNLMQILISVQHVSLVAVSKRFILSNITEPSKRGTDYFVQRGGDEGFQLISTYILFYFKCGKFRSKPKNNFFKHLLLSL